MTDAITQSFCDLNYIKIDNSIEILSLRLYRSHNLHGLHPRDLLQLDWYLLVCCCCAEPA